MIDRLSATELGCTDPSWRQDASVQIVNMYMFLHHLFSSFTKQDV